MNIPATQLLFAVAALVMLAGCDPPITEPDPPPTLIPLTTGNYWSGDDVHYDHDGVETNRSVMRLSVVSDSLIGSTRWSRMSPSAFLVNRAGGVWQRIGTIEQLTYKYPAVAGDTIRLINGAVVTVISTTASVTVPAGTYRCHVYRIPLTFPTTEFVDTVYDYVAPGVGLVRKEMFTTSVTQPGTYRSELWEAREISVH